jgi:hypothetical protein
MIAKGSSAELREHGVGAGGHGWGTDFTTEAVPPMKSEHRRENVFWQGEAPAEP